MAISPRVRRGHALPGFPRERAQTIPQQLPASSRLLSLEAATVVLGLVVALFVWVPGQPWRPEFFSLPKDMALGIAAFVAAILLIVRGPPSWDRWIDAPVIGVLFWGVFLTLTEAINVHAGWRAVGGLCAGALVFHLVRRVSANSNPEPVFAAIVFVVSGLAVLVLLEAYGGVPFFSEPGRRPGATVGNRNLAARLLCLSLPLFWRQIVVEDRKEKRRVILAGLLGLVITAVVLSRSRGAWLITAAIAVGLPLASLAIARASDIRRTRRAASWWAAAIAVGAVAAIMLPNRLAWTAVDFASSARRIIDYRGGTGHGRVIQAKTTLRIIQLAPLHGVGPGNWSIVYPAHSRLGDPSNTPYALFPAPQVPRGDVLSLAAEFGLIGFALCTTAFVAVFRAAARMVKSSDLRIRFSGLMAVGVALAAGALGVIEPVARVSASLLLVVILLGLAIGSVHDGRSTKQFTLIRRFGWSAVQTALAVGSLWFAVEAGRDAAALHTMRSAHRIQDFYRAATLAPHNFEARVTLALQLIRVKRCDLAEPHLLHASQLQPFSGVIARLKGVCDNLGRTTGQGASSSSRTGSIGMAKRANG